MQIFFFDFFSHKIVDFCKQKDKGAFSPKVLIIEIRNDKLTYSQWRKTTREYGQHVWM